MYLPKDSQRLKVADYWDTQTLDWKWHVLEPWLPQEKPDLLNGTKLPPKQNREDRSWWEN